MSSGGQKGYGEWAYELPEWGPTCRTRWSPTPILARTVDTSHEWIVAKTGIRERRFCRPEEAPSDMGFHAALHCLGHAGVDKSAVDLIVVACATPDQSQPAVACMVQERLGVAERQAPAFDVNSVCAGFVFSLNVAQSMMLSSPRQYRFALVIGTDAFSKIMNWDDRRTCVFFGDGAGAVLLSQTDEDGRRIHFRLGSDGRGKRDIQVLAGGTRVPITAGSRKTSAHLLDGWPEGVEFRHSHGSHCNPVSARRARSQGVGSGPRDPTQEQSSHD